MPTATEPSGQRSRDVKSRRILLGFCAIVAAFLIYQASVIWLATARMDSGQRGPMERGAALVPGNGEAWDRLGRLMQFDFENPHLDLAIADYQKAVHDDPLSSYYWMDLAAAYEDAGDSTHAREAFERAKSVYPASALVAWSYGNFLLRQQEYPAGFEVIRQAVEIDPGLLPITISRTWRATQDAQQLLQVLPEDAEAYLQALDFLSSNSEPDAALAVWRRLMDIYQPGAASKPATASKPLPLPRTFAFFDALIRAGRADDARVSWEQALAAAGLPASDAAGTSLVFDGDFAADFSDGGLGWRWDRPIGAAMSFDSPPPGVAGRSLRLDFDGGNNLALDSPSQYVPVAPNRACRFHALIRTEEITTESGISFSIEDPTHPADVGLLTEALNGSHPWGPMDIAFTTGADTHFLLIRVLRNPSRLFENKLAGIVWIADVSVVCGAAPPEKATP